MSEALAFTAVWVCISLYGIGMFLLGGADNEPRGAHDYGRAVELCTEWKDEGLVYDNGHAGDPTFLYCVEMVRWTAKP